MSKSEIEFGFHDERFLRATVHGGDGLTDGVVFEFCSGGSCISCMHHLVWVAP